MHTVILICLVHNFLMTPPSVFHINTHTHQTYTCGCMHTHMYTHTYTYMQIDIVLSKFLFRIATGNPFRCHNFWW